MTGFEMGRSQGNRVETTLLRGLLLELRRVDALDGKGALLCLFPVLFYDDLVA